MKVNTLFNISTMNNYQFTPLQNGRIILCELKNSERKTIEKFIPHMESLIGLWGNQPFLILFDFRNSALRFSPFFADQLKTLPQIDYGRQAILTLDDFDSKQMAFFPNYFASLEYEFFQSYERALAWLEELL